MISLHKSTRMLIICVMPNSVTEPVTCAVQTGISPMVNHIHLWGLVVCWSRQVRDLHVASAHDHSLRCLSSDTASVEEYISQRVGGRKGLFKALTQHVKPDTSSVVA